MRNPFTSITRLLTIRARAEDLLALAEDAQAHPEKYRDIGFWDRALLKAALLADALPVPPIVAAILRKVRDAMLTNWKTTVAGLVGGALTMWAGGMDIQHAVIAAALAALGLAAKDHNVTGTGK